MSDPVWLSRAISELHLCHQEPFLDVFGFANDHRAHPGYYLNEHPGEYEVKVLRNGKLARTLKFSIGEDGKLVDNGISSKNNILGGRVIVPAQVLGDTDGQWDRNAWQMEMFYGNPLIGFNGSNEFYKPKRVNRRNEGDPDTTPHCIRNL